MRFGYLIKLGGDAEIAGALKAGVDSGMEQYTASAEPFNRTALGSEAVRRVAMWQHSPEEWAHMTEEARVIYGGQPYSPKWAEALLVVWAMLCYGVSQAFHWQDAILKGRIT